MRGTRTPGALARISATLSAISERKLVAVAGVAEDAEAMWCADRPSQHIKARADDQAASCACSVDLATSIHRNAPHSDELPDRLHRTMSGATYGTR